MKRLIKRLVSLHLCVLLVVLSSVSAVAEVYDQSKTTEQIEAVLEFVEGINEKDDELCISYYTSDQQAQMYTAARNNPIQEASVEVLAIKQLTYKTGLRAAAVSPKELERYTDITVVLSKEYVTACETATHVTTGEYDRVYVLCFENGSWKLVRRSSANMEIIKQAGEDFEAEDQGNIKLVTEPNSSKAMLYIPSTIDVYLTSSYYTATINFDSYVKNVIPGEWVVSYAASYPAYLAAGAMGSKMYGWYHVVHPKYTGPYIYADVRDDTNDQIYSPTAYSDLATVYRGYVDAALSTISGVAIAKASGGGSENLFETQYTAGSRPQWGGIMGEATIYSLAQQGYSYQYILHYFYDYSDKTDWNPAIIRSHV